MYLPGLPLGPPDHSQSLFHQKLQLLNCCIGRRIAREERERKGQEEVIDLTKKNTSHVDPTTEASDSDSESRSHGSPSNSLHNPQSPTSHISSPGPS